MSKNNISWHEYFMTMAYLIAMKSKDPRSKVGAVIVGTDKEIRSTGYNGLPRGLEDTEARYTKPLKNKIIIHAEENAILHCSRNGVSLKDCIIYVPWIPCAGCAKSIIQVGIKEVIYHKEWPGNYNQDTVWAESINLSKEILSESNVKLIEYSGPLIQAKGYYQEQEINLF